MYQLNFKIETLSPVVMSSMSNSTIMTKTNSEFSGSIVRGVLATKYIEEKNLGGNAHKDSDFQKLFCGGLKFLPAFPEILNRRSFILPLSLQSGKKGTADEKIIKDLLTDEPPKGYKNFRGYGVIDEEKIQKVSVKTNIFMHMSRSGENERLSGKSEDGNIYNYESLNEGQNFCGVILGDEENLKKLSVALNLENNSTNIFVGRSRFTQYGKCKMTFGKIEPVENKNLGEKIFLRLETPLISAEDYFISAEKILQSEVVDALNKIFGKNIFSLGKVFSSNVEIENFVTVWGMKRPRISALAAGSVFELKTSENLSDENLKMLGEKIFDGFGIRTEEGFGQLRFWEPKNFTIGKIEKNKIEKPKNFSKSVVDTAKKILLARCLEQVRIYAHEDAEKLKSQLRHGNMTHFFARLDGMLSAALSSDNVRENFKNLLEEEIRGGSLFETHLKNFRMTNGQLLYDVMMNSADFPRKVDDLKNDLKNFSNLLDELEIKDFKFVENKFYGEYLQNYFRTARKFAAGVKGGGDDE